jgi:hypothetical protein
LIDHILKFICDYTYANQLSKVVVKMDRGLVLVGWKLLSKRLVKLNMNGSCCKDGMIESMFGCPVRTSQRAFQPTERDSNLFGSNWQSRVSSFGIAFE